MTAIEEYTQLIRFRIQNPLPITVHGENHHVVPKCCGGSTLPDNEIRLTSAEHAKAHQLLPLIYTEGEEFTDLSCAANFLLTSREGVKLTPEEAGEIRERFAKVQSERMKGRTPWNKGKKMGPHTDEWKRKVSAKLTGRKHSDERCRHISEALRGKPKSDEARKHMSENHADVSKMKDPTTGRFAKRE